MFNPISAIDNMNHRSSAIVLLWSVIAMVLMILLWPGGKGRRLARQIFAVAVLGFREGLRLKILWTVFLLALIPGVLAYFSDADGTHAGRAKLVLNYCLGGGELLGAVLIVLLSALSVAREIESRIMHTLGTKPVPRWGILAGKALGFWALDLLFIAGIALATLLLVRAVPLRPESRKPDKMITSGTWDDLRRNVLTTRTLHNADNESGELKFKMIKPDSSFTWLFNIDPAQAKGEAIALRFQLTSTSTFASHIDDLAINVAYSDTPEPLIRYPKETVPQDRAFDLYIAPKDVRAGTLAVTIRAPKKNARSPSVVGVVRTGLAADGLLGNIAKAVFLMALQGWILAFITTCWSGVLSFPVTVAMGVILLLGGEMSRHAIELLQGGAARAQNMGAGEGGGVSGAINAQLRFLLSLMPDFRYGGGPSAFVEGQYVSGWALAHTALSMGLLRTVGWALPGILFFSRREVGR